VIGALALAIFVRRQRRSVGARGRGVEDICARGALEAFGSIPKHVPAGLDREPSGACLDTAQEDASAALRRSIGSAVAAAVKRCGQSLAKRRFGNCVRAGLNLMRASPPARGLSAHDHALVLQAPRQYQYAGTLDGYCVGTH